ncbi:Hypothetical predicted protein [Olea europaea subsp. europaea]|uniref:Uncharacterized protein n=1 Tax=Olea europaea subsp. europaea TaxID=158383 RepID=A0A8S0V948_OLEEU|nr:Hypothetical predicted protein [Olea europaea subsp. europaea]
MATRTPLVAMVAHSDNLCVANSITVTVHIAAATTTHTYHHIQPHTISQIDLKISQPQQYHHHHKINTNSQLNITVRMLTSMRMTILAPLILKTNHCRCEREDHFPVKCRNARTTGHVQGQLANSQNNEEVVPPEKETDVDMGANYAAKQMAEDVTAPLEYSWAIIPRKSVIVFDRLCPTRNRQNQPRILPAQTRPYPIPLSHPHLSNLL